MTSNSFKIESDATKRATLTRFKYDAPKQIDLSLYTSVLRGIARNVKVGPFKATSGILLPYYLNATTNFLDKDVAAKITNLMVQYLNHCLKPLLPDEVFNSEDRDNNVLLCGMEVAGGVIVSQLCSANDELLNSWADYVYIRKERKNSGTKQQLEGPQFITSRTSESPKMYAVWVDDALSTGSSMTDGSKMLLQEYNIEVVGALYLVDRSADRRKLALEYQYLSHNMYDTMPILSIFDVEEVDEHFRELNPELYKMAQKGE